MKPQEVTSPADQPTQNSLHYTHSVPSVSQHSWQEQRSGEDTGSAWTPEFQKPFHQLPAGATDIAMETIATATSSKGSKIGAAIQDSSHGAAQPQDRSHPEAPWRGKVPIERPGPWWPHCTRWVETALYSTLLGYGRKRWIFAPFEVESS